MSKQHSTEYYQGLVGQYQAEGLPWPATMHQVAEWAWRRRLYRPQPNAVIRQLAEHLSEALRVEYYTDPQGRTVRAKHAAHVKSEDGEQLVIWDDIRSASHEHMAVSFQGRRKQIVADCYQLKRDVDSYNENRHPPVPIQLVLDFTDDVAEREAMDKENAA